MHLLSSLYEFYKKTKDEISARGEELHKEINQTVEKLHRELDGVRKEPETVLEKKKKVFEKMIEKIDEMNREVTKLQRSHDVQKKKMQTFIPEIEKHKSPSEFFQYSFPKFHGGKIDLQAYFGYVEKLQEEAKVSTVISVIDSGFPSSDRSCLIFRETSTNRSAYHGKACICTCTTNKLCIVINQIKQ